MAIAGLSLYINAYYFYYCTVLQNSVLSASVSPSSKSKQTEIIKNTLEGIENKVWLISIEATSP